MTHVQSFKNWENMFVVFKDFVFVYFYACVYVCDHVCECVSVCTWCMYACV